ncbi:hypothetical protein [Saccharothrix obliqua]|uniref:hypothetical protein n=1 Tax=Saccharothrix obliqua TaxID=2861747 RepID=UPI001C5E2346|nr:hypothetical protein [Saccharothrix obliqua]MBW4722294.1 hypothetical protein [Saccharothrix obliqua]
MRLFGIGGVPAFPPDPHLRDRYRMLVPESSARAMFGGRDDPAVWGRDTGIDLAILPDRARPAHPALPVVDFVVLGRALVLFPDRSVVLTAAAEVDRYATLWARLRQAAPTGRTPAADTPDPDRPPPPGTPGHTAHPEPPEHAEDRRSP